MSVKITVCGAEKDSDEYHASQKLKTIIQHGMPSEVTGEIVIYSSATLIGQAVKDVDIVLLGKLHNYYEYLSFQDMSTADKHGLTPLRKDKVEINSFCTVIEVKKHDISGIVLEGTDIYVRYGNALHSVTAQSNKQKLAARSFFTQTLSYSPFVTNIIWFTQASKDEINSLLTIEGNRIPSNALGADYSLRELMQLVLLQKPPLFYNGRYHLDSHYESGTVKAFHEVLDLFSKSKTQIGELTRKKIEMITNESLSHEKLIDSEKNVSIYRGRAGTGKTVGLIQTAIHLVDEKGARVLMLTYNRALVSDIRRLFAYAELPDFFEEKCVHVDTMHAYFYRLANSVLYNSRLSGEKFISRYDDIMNELCDFLNDNEGATLVKELSKDDEQLNWDYLLIDEAQDWNSVERDIVLKLFDDGNIAIADGGNQFVRQGESCNWNIAKKRNSIKLKYCLRQKQNIITFLNAFSNEMGVLGGKIIPSGKMLGGKVVITTDDKLFDTHNTEIQRCIAAGNSAYDMLYLVPHSLVKKENGKSCFSKSKEFEAAGIHVWDGTNSDNRAGYSVNVNEVRLLQYDSSRGLEGWAVVCMDFDTFMQEKSHEYIGGSEDMLILESPEERKLKYLYNWAMLPMTRAIDTLIITLKYQNSDIGNMLRSIHLDNPDIITWI